jgi:hypothetical protein
MRQSAFLKIVLMCVVVIVPACAPKPASARRSGGGSHGSGGSHGGISHGVGGFHRGGHSSSRGNGHSYGVSRGKAPASSAHMGGGRASTKRMGRGLYAGPGGFFSPSSGNFGRDSNFGGGSFSSSAASRKFGWPGAWQPLARSFRSTTGQWNSFGTSAGRATPASARTWRKSMGGGWHPFGDLGHGGGAEMPPRGYGSNVRADGQWHSFGNSRSASFAKNSPGFTSSGTSRAESWNTNLARRGFNSGRYSTNRTGSRRFSSFSSFSSGRSMANFGNPRFGNAGLGTVDSGNSGFGQSSFSSSLIGSDLSLVPNLLFSGLLRVGTSVFGGPGILGVNVLALAASSIVSGLVSNGFGQGGFAGSNAGFVPGGFGWGLGFEAVPVGPACDAGVSFGRPAWAWSGYCVPYSTYPLGWSGSGSFGGGRNGYNATGGGCCGQF